MSLLLLMPFIPVNGVMTCPSKSGSSREALRGVEKSCAPPGEGPRLDAYRGGSPMQNRCERCKERGEGQFAGL